MAGHSSHANFVNGNNYQHIPKQSRPRKWWLMAVIFCIAIIQVPALAQAQDVKYYDTMANNILATAKNYPVPTKYCSAAEKAQATGFLSGQIARAQALRQEVNAAYKGKKSTVAEMSIKQAILKKIREAQSKLRVKLAKANQPKPEDCSDAGTLGTMGGGGTTKKGTVRGGGKKNETVSLPKIVPLIIPDVPSKICTEQERSAVLQQLTFARGVAQKNIQAINRHNFGKSAAAGRAKSNMFADQQTALRIIESKIGRVSRMPLALEEECKDPSTLNEMPGGDVGPGQLQTPSGAGQNQGSGTKDKNKDKGTYSPPVLTPVTIPQWPRKFCTELERNAFIQQLKLARGTIEANLVKVSRHNFKHADNPRGEENKFVVEQRKLHKNATGALLWATNAKLILEEECKHPETLSEMPSGEFVPGTGRLQTPSGAGQGEILGEDEDPGETEGDDSNSAASEGRTDGLPQVGDEVLVGVPVEVDPELEEFEEAVEALEEVLDEMGGVGPAFEIPTEETEVETEEELEEEDPDGGGN